MGWIIGKKDESQKWIALLNDPAKRAAAANELIRLGSAAVDGLLEALAGKDANVRATSAQLLVNIGKTGIPRLTQAMNSAHPEIRQQIAEILGKIRDPSAVPALLEAARGQYFTVRARAASALAKIGAPEALPTLINLLADSESPVRIAAAQAVGKFKDPGSVICLSDLLLEDREIEVRQAAAQGLAETSLPEAIPYFIEAMADSFWWYERENAAQILMDALTRFGTDAVVPLISALQHYEGTVRRSAAIVLGRIGDTRAVEPLGMTLYDMHYEVGEAAAESLTGFGVAAFGVLAEALKHPEAGIRLHAVGALVKIKDANVLPLLAGALEDPDRQVQKRIIQSLGELGDRRALATLEPIANDRIDRELSMLAREAMKVLQSR